MPGIKNRVILFILLFLSVSFFLSHVIKVDSKFFSTFFRSTSVYAQHQDPGPGGPGGGGTDPTNPGDGGPPNSPPPAGEKDPGTDGQSPGGDTIIDPTQPPGKPVLTASPSCSGTDSIVSLSWGGTANTTSYDIYRRTYVPSTTPGGLRAVYYNDPDFTDSLFFRDDPEVNFNWGAGSPDPTVSPDTFSVRWRGQVQARFTETYTFYVRSNDGVRVWFNNGLRIDNWVDQPIAVEKSFTRTLNASQKYDIIIEYYENTGDAEIQLSWSSPSTPKQIIPSSALYPSTPTDTYLGNTTDTTFTNTGLKDNTYYLFMAQAIGPGGRTSSDWVIAITGNCGASEIPWPHLSDTCVAGLPEILVDWGNPPPQNAASYIVWRSTDNIDGNGNDIRLTANPPPNYTSTSYTDGSVANSSLYYYRVTSITTSGGTRDSLWYPISTTNCTLPVYSLTGTVFVDTNGNRIKDAGEAGYQNAKVAISGTRTGWRYTSASGNYGFVNNLPAGTYTATLTTPSGYKVTTPISCAGNLEGTPCAVSGIAIPPSSTLDFGIIQFGGYTVSGNVFVDTDKDEIKNGTEANYTGAISITSTSGTVIYPGPGAYSVSSVAAGSVTVSYANLPLGYQMTYPRNGPPPLYAVTVGPLCSTDVAHGSSCAGGNITNLNFGITNSTSWFHCEGADCRVDSFSNPIPATATPACGGPYASIAKSPMSNTPGIIFSGSSNPYFGLGQASPDPYNWQVGGSAYPEPFISVNPGVIRTSYGYMSTTARQSGITPTDLSTVCDLASCTLPAGLANGVYRANGNLALNFYTFPTNKDFVILVNGNLTITGNILVPNGSTATFAVSQDIRVQSTVGVASTTSCNPPTVSGGVSTGCNVEGFYSADRSFIIEGAAACPASPDERLNIAGAVVVNAAFQGGSFQNLRDMCDGNLSCPSFAITERPDFILNAPEFIKHPNYLWHEVAP